MILLIFLFTLLYCGPAGATIKSRIREVSAKSEYMAHLGTEFRAENTVDGNLSTAWISETNNRPEWLKLSLAVEGSKIEKVVIVNR